MVNETDERVSTENESDRPQISQEEIESLKNRNVAVLTVMMPPGLREAITSAAEASSESAATFARKALADAVGYDLPVQAQSRARKYATEEERIAANKERAKSRRETTNELLRRLRAGEISL